MGTKQRDWGQKSLSGSRGRTLVGVWGLWVWGQCYMLITIAIMLTKTPTFSSLWEFPEETCPPPPSLRPCLYKSAADVETKYGVFAHEWRPISGWCCQSKCRVCATRVWYFVYCGATVNTAYYDLRLSQQQGPTVAACHIQHHTFSIRYSFFIFRRNCPMDLVVWNKFNRMTDNGEFSFYRAKPSRARYCHCQGKLSVRPPVTSRYRDHVGILQKKVISRLMSLIFSLSADPNMTDLLQREHPKF